MSPPVLFTLEKTLPLLAPLRTGLDAECGALEARNFPDGETYLRVLSPVSGRQCVVLANLLQPDAKILPLQFLSHTLRAQGATSVGLVAPYLCYMRQDKVFNPGEAVTSRIFAGVISSTFDWLVTVAPHLHRYHNLSEIYSIPALAISGMPALQSWIASQADALLVGPDAESRQWVETLARATGLHFVVGKKQRRGDRDVQVSLATGNSISGTTEAIIVDDVISSGHTVLETISALQRAGVEKISCAAVHGVFAENADRKILNTGADQLAVSNSIPGDYCTFDLSSLLVPAIHRILAEINRGDCGDKQP
ncbi:ribose-phosphate diphosphokinase [Microbulbifer mangrovi]|uniref:ribose-phosphate diphosphokinase n=1 Tax=Microbulbifer mangrovi TaxID=927787 RepID=UPI0009906EF8|nr:ribose-phosphate diphosphokinase [Microbulbifer mangrovi]